MCKSEFAAQYGYNKTAFFRLVHKNEPLMRKLLAIGYNKYIHVLPPKILVVLYDWYGNPNKEV